MNIFTKLMNFIRGLFHKVIPYNGITSAERIETPISTDMINALDLWCMMYQNRAPWVENNEDMKSLNLAALVCSEIARQVLLEMKWNITGKTAEKNERSEYLSKEFEKCVDVLRKQLEIGCAAGGMTIKPYPKNGHIYFNFTADWALYPIAFDDDGGLADVVFQDTYADGKDFYTRLERHKVEGTDVRITQRAFKSASRDTLGKEILLTDVPQWAELPPEAVIKDSEKVFGWFRVAMANNVELESPMGVSVFSKATGIIRDADEQYSRLMWEYKGSELAVDVDPTVLRPKKNGNGEEMPELNKRLFRAVDLGLDETYKVFSPPIRDASLLNGLNATLTKVEDLCGLSRGSLTDVPADARTATELRILKQRSYATIADNQKALERCLRDVVKAMDTYATLYDLAPAGDYDVSFEWDDSIITDAEQQLGERMMLMDKKAYSSVEMRMWYFGETKQQAEAAIQAIREEEIKDMETLLPAMPTSAD